MLTISALHNLVLLPTFSKPHAWHFGTDGPFVIPLSPWALISSYFGPFSGILPPHLNARKTSNSSSNLNLNFQCGTFPGFSFLTSISRGSFPPVPPTVSMHISITEVITQCMCSTNSRLFQGFSFVRFPAHRPMPSTEWCSINFVN